MKLTISRLRRLIRETLESDIEAQIAELMKAPEYQDLDALIEFKYDNDETKYNFMELQAVGRNMTKKKLGREHGKHVVTAGQGEVDLIKKTMEEYGIKFVDRQPDRNFRGFTSGKHGSHPFAGNSGGSGMGWGAGGPVGFGMGGGVGSMGGGSPWNANDPRNLPMSSRRRR